jgi:hypothetical protein
MAAGGTTSNVELGPGRLYFAAIGTSEPTNASSALPSAWNAVGYTEEGSAFTTSLTREEILVAEEIDPIKYVLTKRANSLVVSIAEMTRSRLCVAFGWGVDLSLVPTLEPPIPGTDVGVMIVWDSNEDPTVAQDGQGNRRWLFRSAKPSGDLEIVRRKAPAKSLIPVTFNIEKPSGLQPFKVFPNSNGLI